jgi:RNA polymerase sigma factor (TIGR02999 family)
MRFRRPPLTGASERGGWKDSGIEPLMDVRMVMRVAESDMVAASTREGCAPVAEDSLPMVYAELRKLAAAQMARERAGLTLQPTALVHEAWLRLGGDRQPDWENRGHFFGAAAKAMRRILIERARRRLAARRGGDRTHLPIDGLDLIGAVNDPRILEVDEALERFARVQPQKAELVRLRYFAGLELAEAAQALGISEATAKRWWVYSRAWLLRELKSPQ